jgi:hypothetical protein
VARVSRSRTRPSPYGGGTYIGYKNGNVVQSISPDRSSYISTCNDSHGSPVVDSTFSSIQYAGSIPSFSGEVQPTLTTSVDRAVYSSFTPSAGPAVWTGMSPLGAPNGWMLDLVAGTNPSRPVVNIPELVEDLVDLPKAIRGLGNLILNPGNLLKPKGFAGEYLGVQFGWVPLIEDLTKLLDFQNYAIKRNKELNQLYSGQGLRRRLKFADDTTVTALVAQTSPPSLTTISLQSSVTVKREQWATIHWKPTSPPSYHPSDTDNNRLATKLVLGATPEAMANGLWKVIPWTWMIGWFTNLGQYTLAHSWTVPADHGSGCFMSQATGTWQAGGVSATNVKTSSLTSSGTATRTVKTRAVSSTVTAGVNMPYLDMFRLSILGALFVQKFSGKFGGLVS